VKREEDGYHVDGHVEHGVRGDVSTGELNDGGEGGHHATQASVADEVHPWQEPEPVDMSPTGQGLPSHVPGSSRIFHHRDPAEVVVFLVRTN
jgi:hypothetical protein